MQSAANDDQILTPQEVNDFNEIVKSTQTKILNLLRENPNLIRVILMGITGSGKSSLSCSLANKSLTINIGNGKKIELVGEGVVSGCKAGTREPSITVDLNSGMVYCDCPGFEDTNGIWQEIINSFVIDSLFKKENPNQINKFKIILVAQAAEFEAIRGRGIKQSIKRLDEMFTDHNQLKNGIGLIVTKGDDEMTGIDHIDTLGNDTPIELREIFDFFKSHPDRVFSFPKPSRKKVNQQYQFNDKQRLISYLKTGYIVNPQHQIALSETARLKMKNLRIIHSHNVSDKIQYICIKIGQQFRKEQKSDEMGKWIDIIHELLRSRVKCAKDFGIIVKKHVPNCQQYESDFNSLAEFEIFDSFIDQVLYEEQDTSCLSEVIRAWSQDAIIELEKNQTRALKAEFQEKQLTRQKEMIDKQDKLQQEHERKVNEMKQMLEEQNKRFIDQQKRIEDLQNTISRQSQEIINLKKRRCLLI